MSNPPQNKPNKLLPIALLALSQSVWAQQIPSAGSQLQQIPPSPAPSKAAPAIQIEQGGAPATAAADRTKITVKRLQVKDATVFSEAELIALTGFQPGSELTLTELRAMAAKIADHYHAQGYFVAQAFLPAQDIQDGAVTIAVLEGRYGQVSLHNQSSLSDSVASGLLAGLNSGDAVASGPLESRLLRLSDIPGVEVKSTLVPGASVGASDLIVDVTPGKRLTGSVEADNQGSRYTGANRLGATLNINNPSGHGDIVTLRALTSAAGLDYGRAAYQTLLGQAQAGVAYAQLGYRLGKEFASLQAKGTAKIASVYGSYPLIRSRSNNLYALLDLDAKTLQDKVDATSTVTDKKAQVAMASLNGDHRDNWGGGGLNSYSLTWSLGNLDIQSPAARAVDAVTAQSNGHYSKLALSATRLQSLAGPVSLYAALKGQLASKNLDPSEKMELGGANAVRAYPEGEAYADQGYVLNLEARLPLPKLSDNMPGQLQLVGFVDTGTVTLNKNPWTVGPNRRTLSGTGIGLTWADSRSFVVTAYYAHKLGSAVATSAPDAKGRFWLQAVKYF